MKKSSEPKELTEEAMTDEEMKQFFDLDSPPMASKQPTDERNNTTPISANLEIPHYLSSIQQTSFVKMIEQQASSDDRRVNREDVRQTAILTHHLTMLEWKRSLLDSISKGGTDLLESHAEYLQLWPSSVITMTKERTSMTAISDIDEIRMSDHDCHRWVERQLHDLETEERQLRDQWNHAKKLINDFERIWEKPIRAWVMQQNDGFHQCVRCKIQFVEFDCRAHRLECEFRLECPSATQMQRARQLLDLKCQYENARHEALLLKERIAQNKLPASLDALQRPAPHSFRSLSDAQLAQQLSDRQQTILQYYRKEMITLFLDAAEANLDESHALFNSAMDHLRESQQSLSVSIDQWSPAMIVVLDQRLALITERLEYFHRFKLQQLAFQIPIIRA